jgi:pSer/pThr/pTyr-binding forkhead associated (FHA) protein
VFTPDAVGQSEPACAARNIAPQRGRHQAGGAAAISRAAGQALHLEIPEDGTRVARLPVDRFPFTIGRRAGNALVLPDPRVSREHAIIERDGGRFRLRDLGSHNGTTINGQPVAQAELCDGDRLAIGGFELLVRLRAGR